MSEFNPLEDSRAAPRLEALGRRLRRLESRERAISGAFWAGLALGLLQRTRRKRRQLNGQIALVTGGTRGLGLQLVRELSSRGASVAFCARHADEVERAERMLQKQGHRYVKGYVADIAHPDGPATLASQVARDFGPVTLLVNNAGTIQVLPFVDSDESAFHDCMELFVYGPLRLCREVLPDMMAFGRGTIVNVASVGGQLPAPHLVPYNAGKAALVALSEGMSVELDRYGVNVLTVKPGLMRTGSHRNALFGGRSGEEYSWFSKAAVHPALALSTESAARRVVDAVVEGRRTLAVGWEARLGPLFHTMLPELSHRLTSAVEKRLPSAGSQPHPLRMGAMVAPEAEPMGPLLDRLEKAAVAAHQSARYTPGEITARHGRV
jgi:short-subunit dehydrogenase